MIKRCDKDRRKQDRKRVDANLFKSEDVPVKTEELIKFACEKATLAVINA